MPDLSSFFGPISPNEGLLRISAGAVALDVDVHVKGEADQSSVKWVIQNSEK